MPECTGCGTGTCTLQPVTAGNCMSTVHLEAPCGDLQTSETLDSTFTFGTGSVDVTHALTRADGSVCSFTGTGTRS